jgi:tetratricopeptide (TPR) repeat protein
MDEAISHLERAAALAPGNEEAQLNLARAYGATQQFTLAIAHDEKALDRLPGSAELHSEFGEALVGAQRVDEAITQFRKALELAPGLLDAQYGLGTALMMKGQLAEALAQWRLVLRKDPDHLQTLNDAAWLLATSPDGKLRNGAEALKLAAHAAQLTSGKESAILGTLAAAYAETGQFDRALDVEQRAIQLATERGDATSAGVLQERLVALRAKTPIREP